MRLAKPLVAERAEREPRLLALGNPDVGDAHWDLPGAAAEVEEIAEHQVAGIHPATYYRWIERGEADIETGRESSEREFCEAATRARANARIAAVGHIRAAMSSDWRAALAYLERTDPKRWARTKRLHHPGWIDREGSRRDLSKLSKDELAELEGLLERAEE